MKEPLPEFVTIVELVRKRMLFDKHDYAQVAEAIGKNYQQVYGWLNYKKGTPNFANLTLLREYASGVLPRKK